MPSSELSGGEDRTGTPTGLWLLVLGAGLLAVSAFGSSPPKRVPLRRNQRKRVFARGSGKCHYCGQFVPAAGFHVDHSNPVSNGGTNHMRNLRLACAECNLSKGAKRNWRG